MVLLYKKWSLLNGSRILTYENWHFQGEFHREIDPATSYYVLDPNGEVYSLYKQEWKWRGVHHRLDGPAIIYPNSNEPGKWIVKGEKCDHSFVKTRIVRLQVWWRWIYRKRQRKIQRILEDSGMTVFPGLMSLI